MDKWIPRSPTWFQINQTPFMWIKNDRIIAFNKYKVICKIIRFEMFIFERQEGECQEWKTSWCKNSACTPLIL